MNNFKQQERLWSGIIKVLNNISYVSAGAISLSVTFLGYVLSIGSTARSILQEPVVGNVTALLVLFASWTLLFIATFSGVVIQFYIEWFIFNSQTALLYEDFKTTVRDEDKKNVDLVIDPVKAHAENLREASRWIQGITIISFAIGVLLLAIFAMLVAQKLVSI